MVIINNKTNYYKIPLISKKNNVDDNEVLLFGKDNVIVKYYIPKVCNYMMVNKLRGITPVYEDSKYAVG